MLISIIIPIYNVEQYIEECLESVYQQTYPNIEVILVNDCTPDNSMIIANDIAEKYKTKYPTVVVNHKQNKGASEARNNGIKVAKGEYIYFIDSDDIILPDAISILANVANKHKEIELIKGEYITDQEFRPTNKYPILIHPIILYNYDCQNQFLIKDTNLFIWNILYKKDFITRHSLSFKSNITIYEDALFRIKATQFLTSIAIIPTITYFYRNNNSSLSHKASTKHLISIKELLLILEDILSKDIHPLNIYLSCFCKNAFLYWSRPCRATDEHDRYLKTIQRIVKRTASKHYRLMKIKDLCLLSPFYLPYNIAKYYVKIIWKIIF